MRKKKRKINCEPWREGDSQEKEKGRVAKKMTGKGFLFSRNRIRKRKRRTRSGFMQQ